MRAMRFFHKRRERSMMLVGLVIRCGLGLDATDKDAAIHLPFYVASPPFLRESRLPSSVFTHPHVKIAEIVLLSFRCGQVFFKPRCPGNYRLQ